jgi:glycosyltransferase involved in cell wall biosynthesis
MKLTVLITTYNQEPFLAAALEGALRQQTSFPFDLLVADDGSTDGTRGIIAAYQSAHPDRIRTFLPPHNLGGMGNVLFARALDECRSEYIAFCEGDDYWTDDGKLQLAVTLLEASPQFVGVFHAVDVVAGAEASPLRVMRPPRRQAAYTFDDLVPTNFIPFSSVVYRRRAVTLDAVMDVLCSDWAFHLLQLQYGPIAYLDRVMGAYRQHSGGTWTRMAESARIAEEIAFTSRIAEIFDFHDAKLLRRAMAAHWADLAVQRRIEGRKGDARDCARAALRADPFRIRNAQRMAVGWTRITRALEWRWKLAVSNLVRRPTTP